MFTYSLRYRLGLLALPVLAFTSASAVGATLYQSSFTGANGTPLGSTPDWINTWDQSDANNTLAMQIQNNQGYLTKTTTASGSTGTYKGVQAEISGAPAKFDPAQDLRFQLDVNQMLDTRSRTADNIYFVQYLSDASLTSQPYNATAERFLLFAAYNKGTSPSASTLALYFNQAEGASSGNGVNLWTVTLPANGLELPDSSQGTKMTVQLSMELRNNAAGDARAGYQIAYNGVGQGWNYSNWFNVESGSQPFTSNWASNWAGNTQWYMEIGGGAGTGGPSQTWVDNAIVTGTPVPEPASLGLLAAAGLLAMRRRRTGV